MYLIDPMSCVELLIFLLFIICNFVFRNQVSICKFLGSQEHFRTERAGSEVDTFIKNIVPLLHIICYCYLKTLCEVNRRKKS